MRIWKGSLLAAVLALAPSLAFAHTGIGHVDGFAHGFTHPFLGLDHLLAMTLVGTLAYQLGGRAIYIVPAAFVAVMAVGGYLGMAHVGLPFAEMGIALSVIVLGAAVALNVSIPVALAALVVGVFALAHGHAHGTEMPATAAGISYGLGFMIATAILHAVGIGIGRAADSTLPARAALARSFGAVAAVIGAGFLVGVI
jgi:urease accessory protein